MFLVLTVYASVSATRLTFLYHLPCTYKGRQAHRFAPTTVDEVKNPLTILSPE